MAKRRSQPAKQPLPPPLPPETRTVGQLVAESLRFYGQRFWPSLALGLSLAALNQIVVAFSRWTQVVVSATVGALLLSASFAAAAALVAGVRLDAKAAGVAVAVGVLVFAPAPFLASLYLFPAVAWLALAGCAVPAAVVERTGLRASLARGVALGRADYVHALGSLATLGITYFLTRTVLVFLLRGQAEAALRTAVFLADIVISPILFLGAAHLYFDQAARAARRREPEPELSSAARNRRRRRDADVHHADDPDPAGSPDATVESRASARGEL